MHEKTANGIAIATLNPHLGLSDHDSSTCRIGTVTTTKPRLRSFLVTVFTKKVIHKKRKGCKELWDFIYKIFDSKENGLAK